MITILLSELNLEFNELYGPIPNAIGSLSWIRFLDLYSGRSFSGTLPESLGQVTLLQHFEVTKNRLSGTIPHVVQAWAQLEWCSFGYNSLLAGPIPDAVGAWRLVSNSFFQSCAFSGSLPQALGSWGRQLETCSFGENRLLGQLPDGMSGWTSAYELYIFHNSFSGHMPDMLPSMTSIVVLDARTNALSGSIPDTWQSMARLSLLMLYQNDISGPIPGAVACWTNFGSASLGMNRLTGPIPDGVASLQELLHLELNNNRLVGAIPIGIASLRRICRLFVNNNRLSGSLPAWLLLMSNMKLVMGHDNRLSGSIGAAIIRLQVFIISENLITGCLPSDLSAVTTLLASGNMLEGSISKTMHPHLDVLDTSGQPGGRGGLAGPLPSSLTRASHLSVLAASQHELQGVTPALMATLNMLSLHNNELQVLSDARFKNTDGVVLVYNNLLSCCLPLCGNAPTRMSLSGLGNELSQPKQGFPAWVSPVERDKLFWTADAEGRALMAKILAATLLAAGVAARELRGQGPNGVLLKAMSQWHVEPGSLSHLASGCVRFLSYIATGSLFRVLFLMLLLFWDVYKCPPTMTLASACLRDAALIHGLVVFMWGCLGFFGPAMRSLVALEVAHGDTTARRSAAKKCFQWSSFLLVVLVLSLPAILFQVGKSVPGSFRGDGGTAVLAFVSACIGVVQGLLGAFVLPSLAQKLTSRKHVSTTLANVMMNSLIPAMIVIRLDTACFGNWVALWRPCRTNSQQFLQVFDFDVHLDLHLPITVLRPHEVCDPYHARGATSMARCIELTLLRLQDIWLGKLIMIGLVIPACRISLKWCYSESAGVVGRLAILLGYSIVASGHLPLVMPLLLLATLGEMAMAAASWSKFNFRHTSARNVATISIVIIQLSTAMAQLASASADLPVLGLVIIFLVVHMKELYAVMMAAFRSQELMMRTEAASAAGLLRRRRSLRGNRKP